MSWKGFTKAMARLPQIVKKKTGMSEGLVDEDYLELESKFHSVEQATNKFLKDLKDYKKSLTKLVDHQTEFGHSLQRVLKPMNDQEYTNDQIIVEYVDNLVIMKESLIQKFDSTFDKELVNTLSEFQNLLGPINSKLTKRNNKLIDFDRHTSSMKKLESNQNRSANDEKKMFKLEKVLAQSENDYNQINDLLKFELPQFLRLKSKLIDPCFSSLFEFQVEMCQIVLDNLGKLRVHFDMTLGAAEGYSEKKQMVDKLLSEMEVICATDYSMNNLELSSNSVSPTKPKGGAIASFNTSTESNSKPTNSKPLNSKPSSRESSSSNNASFVTALYDFEAQTAEDISFKAGDRIQIVQKTDQVNDWWIGMIRGKTGQFPGNYVE